MPDLTDYYKNLLPPKYRSLIESGKAYIFRNYEGYWYCYEAGCFKLIRKTSDIMLRIVKLLANNMMTISEISKHLGIPYNYVRNYIYYYYKAGLLQRVSQFYTVNDFHPQIQFIYKILLSVNSLNAEIRLDLLKFAEKEPVHKNMNENKRVETISIDDVLSKAERLASGLSERERLIIIKLVEWRNFRKRWYVCVSDINELSEVLGINIDPESLKKLEKLGIIFRYFDKRHKQHCIRISKALVE